MRYNVIKSLFIHAILNSDKPKRGRPFIDPSKRMRALVWYYAVKGKLGRLEKDEIILNDSQLGSLFGTDSEGSHRVDNDHIRIFEPIRRDGVMPSDGRHPKRNYDLVERVEKYNGYHGTAAIMHSPFWRLVDKRVLSLKEIREIIVECIIRLGLLYEAGNYEDDGQNDIESLVQLYPDMSIETYFTYVADGDFGYDNAMAGAFIHLPASLDYIALLGALALEAIEAGNMQIASDQIKSFSIILREFCSSSWLNPSYEKGSNYYSTNKKIPKLAPLGERLYDLGTTKMKEALNADALKGLKSYSEMLAKISGVNLKSGAAAFLNRHQRLLWRR